MGGRDERTIAHAADMALAKSAATGDRNAQRTLLSRVLPELRGVARAMMGPGADADDATQHAGLKILERVGSYRGDARLEAWSRRVGTRVCLDLMRSRKRRREVGREFVGHEPVQAPPSLAWEALPRPLDAYLDEISEPQRQAVVMRHALGYSVPEIAELLEIPVDTAKSRLLFGRRALRKLIRRDLQTKELAPLRLQAAKGGT
jgi:RNA polymerase sigma-70 factor (ECF subfamily)